MSKPAFSLEKCRGIANRANGVSVDSFSGLNRILSDIPNIVVTIETNDTGVLPVLATLFDSSELADASIGTPRQTPAQSITLETHLFPDRLCVKPERTVDYSIGFRLGSKYAEIAYGWFNDMLKDA